MEEEKNNSEIKSTIIINMEEEKKSPEINENNSQQNLILEINDNQGQDNQEESNSKKEEDKDASKENKEMESEDNNQEQITEESNLETDLNNNSYRKEESEPSISDLDKLLDENNNNNNNITFDQRRLSLKIKNLKDIFESKPEKIDNIEKLNRKFSLITTEENKPKENKPEINRRLDHRNTMKIQSFKRNSIKDLTKMFDISKGLKPIIEEKKKESKILPNSDILSKENPNMIIYKFPNESFRKNEIKNSKIILFLGDAQEFFINAFINVCRGISFEDKIRYKIDSNNKKQNEIMTYCIKSYDTKKIYDLMIISIPFGKEKNENYVKKLYDTLSKISSYRIHLICYTFEEITNNLNISHLNEIYFYKCFIHYLNMRDKLVFLCSSNESMENYENKDYINNLFNFDKNDYLYEENCFKDDDDDFIFINNKFIYENDENTKNNWNILIEKIQFINNKIRASKSEDIIIKSLYFFKGLLLSEIKDISIQFNKFLGINKHELINKEAFIFIYFLQIINYNEDKSNIILSFYNLLIKDIHSYKKIDTNDYELKFIDDKNGNKALNFISKFHFNKLKNIHFHNCSLVDQNINSLKNLVSSNLEYLDLSKNQIQDINTLFKKDVFSNLKVLNLSNNNIVDILSLSKINFSNLEKLYLYSNKIKDIECFVLNDSFDKLKILDLSNNNIHKLQKINIKSLQELHLLNNEINSGINDFIENNNFSNNLNLEIKENSIKFNFSKTLIIDFEYISKDKKIEEFLNELNYKGIHSLQISGIGFDKKLIFDISESTLKFNNNKNGNLIINILSKFPFNNNVSSINLSNNELIDKDILLIKNYFTQNLIKLNLSENKISDMNVFIEKDSLSNLEEFNLSHNNITDISLLSKSKLNNLKVLNLNFNKISNIDFLQLDTNFDKLEKIDLSNNLINKLVTINIKTLKELNLLNNEINSGIDIFSDYIINLSDELLLENLGNSILFNYGGNLIVTFQYYIKDNNIQFLKNIKFNGIHILKIKNFEENIEFLENESLKELQELDLKDNKIDNLSAFNKIYFINIKKMTFNEYPINDGLNNLKVFPKITVDGLVILDNCIYVKFKNPEFGLKCTNYNILMDDLVNKTDKIKIKNIPDNNLFSYNSFRDYTIPIFKEIKAKKLSIPFNNNKYSCNIEFKFKDESFSKNFIFDDLCFLKNDDILSKVELITFSNIIFNDNVNFETDVAFKNLKRLELNNCIIENLEIFEQINNKIIKEKLLVISNSTKCNTNLQQYMDQDIFSLKINKEIKSNELNFIKPFKFDIQIDFKQNYDILKNLNFKNIEILDLSSTGLKNIDFLTNNSLISLNKLLLSNNEIEDISILNIENVPFLKLKVLNLKDNPIKKGIEVLKDQFFTKCSFVYIKYQIDEERIKISAEFKYPNYDLDFYINDINDISNIFENEKIFLNYEFDENDKIVNTIKMTKENYMEKKEILQFLYLMENKDYKWIYDKNIVNKKNIINSAYKLLTNQENNDNANLSFLRNIDIFLNSNAIRLLFPNIYLKSLFSDSVFLQLTTIEITKISYVDIKPLCESEYFINLNVLKICDAQEIDNLDSLKKATFVNLNELFLVNDKLENIDFLKDCPFNNLLHLDCSNNQIKSIPSLNFPNLKVFNLTNNKMTNEEELPKIGTKKCNILLGGNEDK